MSNAEVNRPVNPLNQKIARSSDVHPDGVRAVSTAAGRKPMVGPAGPSPVRYGGQMNVDKQTEATARPWSVENGPAGPLVNYYEVHGQAGRVVAVCRTDFIGSASRRGLEENAANAALLVERVNGWEALLAERDALRAECAALREALASVVDRIDQAVDGKIHTGRMEPVCGLLSEIQGAAQMALEGK